MLSGKDIFKLVDAIGLPLDIIIIQLRENKESFNIAEFIEAAKNAGWKRERLYNMILYSSKENETNEKFVKLLNSYLNFYFK